MATPSLAMIPSGYKDGKVYSVLPTDGDGDFDFSRGSNATRVNKDGLIETMPLELGSELVTNGGFATDSDWTKTGSWSIGGGYANVSSTGTRSMSQNVGVPNTSKTYKIQYEILSTNGGNIKFTYGGISGELRTTTGIFTEYIQPSSSSSSNIIFDALNVFIGSIDNVSVKEVISGLDLPRLDYSDSSCPSLLLEPQIY